MTILLVTLSLVEYMYTLPPTFSNATPRIQSAERCGNFAQVPCLRRWEQCTGHSSQLDMHLAVHDYRSFLELRSVCVHNGPVRAP